MNNITDYGAKADGITLTTDAIQRAIDRTAERGGGFVAIPPGVWLTGSLFLRSHVWLDLSPGAMLLGSPNPDDYPVQRPAYRSFHDAGGFRALIYAEGVENIGLRGGGTIDGQGGKIPFVKDEHDVRPRMIQFVSCRDVTVENLRLQNSAMWLQHYLNCDRVLVSDLRIWNHSNHNNDMIDIDGSREVVVTRCVSDTDDDGLTLKSTGTALCENVIVSDCVISSRCNAIKLGTETTGGFRNVSIRNCVVRPTRSTTPGIYGHPEGISAVTLEVVDGGRMEGVVVSQLNVEGTRSPIFIRLANRGRRHRADAARPPLGMLRQVLLEDIIVRGAGSFGSCISGIPGAAIEDVTLSRIRIDNAVGPENGNMPGLPPEREKDYPEATMFGVLPASGLFIRHARNIKLRDVTFNAAAGDRRPVITTHEVADLQAGGLPAVRI
jgi:hypothetical protein